MRTWHAEHPLYCDRPFPESHPYGHRWQPAGCSSEMHRRTCRDRAIAHKNLSADSTPEGGEKHGGQNAEHARLPSVCGRGAPRGAPILIYPWGTRDCYVQRECSPISPNRLGSRSPRSRSTSGLCVFVKVSENGGEGGIRTHGGSRLAGFQDRCFQPLSHLSKFKAPSPAGERGIFGGQGYLISVGDDQIFPQQ